MKAAIYTAYGPPEVVRIAEVDTPTPGENEVLVHLRATSVSRVDSIFRGGRQFFARMATGIFRPRQSILGTEVAGVIATVGDKVTRYREGDRVFGDTVAGQGTHAKYICLPENGPITHMPDTLSFEEAAAIPYAGLTALPFLRDEARLGTGQSILVNGASGSVGGFAVQLAHHLGAEVTGVCGPRNMDRVREMGASRVINYREEDFTQTGERWDVIFDAVGTSSFGRSKQVLRKDGLYMTTVIGLPILLQMAWSKIRGGKRALIAFTGLRSLEEKHTDMAYLRELVEQGVLQPQIDRSYPLDRIVDAYRYVDGGHKKGNVIITLPKKSHAGSP